MDHARSLRYRRLALKETDQHKASLLRLIADESDRGSFGHLRLEQATGARSVEG